MRGYYERDAYGNYIQDAHGNLVEAFSRPGTYRSQFGMRPTPRLERELRVQYWIRIALGVAAFGLAVLYMINA